MKNTRISSKLKNFGQKEINYLVILEFLIFSSKSWILEISFKKWNFSQKRYHLSCDFEILEFWSNRHEIDLQRTVFFRSFENWLFHIVMHQKLLSKDKNSIWKGRNVWLWWFHSIIRRIFLFWKLFRDSWREIWALSMDSALKSIFDFPIHAINAFSIQSVRKMVKTQERWRGLVMPY